MEGKENTAKKKWDLQSKIGVAIIILIVLVLCYDVFILESAYVGE